ncbi:aminodeoxychorismate lyase [Cohnella boryungensis]|uniref:Aminodeoxychorismate lyase n=1 Tax=Cohnella boryungensis TaxID=768479 RepID=A0ABV8S8J1_9BACL
MSILYNGQLMSRNEAVISAFDHGFLYGMGLFETMRTYGGRPWLLEEHAKRLEEGCAMMGIRYAPNPDAMRRRIGELLQANGLSDGYIRWSVSAGEGEIGLPTGAYAAPNEIVYAKGLATDDPATRHGKILRLLKLPRSTPEGAHRTKSFHYMNNIAAKRELLESGAPAGTEGLFLNGDGRIVEGLVSNVFWLLNGKLYTPAAETGLLEGITRAYVIQMAEREGIRVEIGCYGWEEIAGADEVFLTNSIQEIVPVTRLEDASGQGGPPGGRAEGGPITSRLMRLYRAAAERNDRG